MCWILQSCLPFLATAALGLGVGGCDKAPDPGEARRELDAQGGLKAVLTLGEPSGADRFVENLGRRLASLGHNHVLIERDGPSVTMSIAGAGDGDSLRALLTPARLELREVHPDSSALAQAVFDGAEIVPGYKAFRHDGVTRDGEAYTEYLLLNKRSGIGAADIEDAWPQTQGTDHQVGIKLTPAGGDKMIALTEKMQPGVSRIAIMLDDEVITAPVVQTIPLGRNFVVQGQDTFAEASQLATRLLTPLDIPFTLESIEEIAPKGP